MSSWLERQASNHYVQLGAVALLSGATVAGTIYGVQSYRRKERVEELKASIPALSEDHKAELLNEFGAPQRPARTAAQEEDDHSVKLAQRALAGDYPPELIDEQLTRTKSFLTPPRFAKLRSAFVIVVGLGGVGSHCVGALARSGVGKIRLIDFDQVTLSSLNRHAVATLTDVGTSKVACVKKRLQAVTPWVEWEGFTEMWRSERAEVLLGGRPDYVVDAIDNIDSKVALLRWCQERKIKVVSSMGAGCKSDPTRVFVGDISTSVEDPLSRATRRKLKLAGIGEGIPVVFSTEKPGPGKAELLPLPEDEFQKGKVNELSVLPDFRARILPVLGTMPATFGCIVANFVIMEITNYPHDGTAGKGREKLYDAVLSNLQGLIERVVRQQGEDPIGLRLPITKDDVGYLIEEVFRGKSVISGLPTRLALVPWERPPQGFQVRKEDEGQKSVQIALSDLVCITKEEVAKHEAQILLGKAQVKDVYPQSVLQKVEERRKEEKQYQAYR